MIEKKTNYFNFYGNYYFLLTSITTAFAEALAVDNVTQNAYNENAISDVQAKKVGSSVTVVTPFLIALIRKTSGFFRGSNRNIFYKYESYYSRGYGKFL